MNVKVGLLQANTKIYNKYKYKDKIKRNKNITRIIYKGYVSFRETILLLIAS
jgi:hypothetical protein